MHICTYVCMCILTALPSTSSCYYYYKCKDYINAVMENAAVHTVHDNSLLPVLS